MEHENLPQFDHFVNCSVFPVFVFYTFLGQQAVNTPLAMIEL